MPELPLLMPGLVTGWTRLGRSSDAANGNRLADMARVDFDAPQYIDVSADSGSTRNLVASLPMRDLFPTGDVNDTFAGVAPPGSDIPPRDTRRLAMGIVRRVIRPGEVGMGLRHSPAGTQRPSCPVGDGARCAGLRMLQVCPMTTK